MSTFIISKLGMGLMNWHLKFNEIWYSKDLAISQPSTVNTWVKVTIISNLDDCHSFWSGPLASPLRIHCLFSNDSWVTP